MKSRLLSLPTLAASRPFLYHLTAAGNVSRIRRKRRLYSAAQLFDSAGRVDLIRVRRRQHETIRIDGEDVTIRDQAPLHRGNVKLGSGWAFEDLVEALNRQVFFWPGNDTSPIPYGIRHFERYGDEDTRIIRVSLLDIVAANTDREPFVCPYNSGSPRCNAGRPSPRSANTFIAVRQAELRPSQVIEVTFSPDVQLPKSTGVAEALGEPWTPLFK